MAEKIMTCHLVDLPSACLVLHKSLPPPLTAGAVKLLTSEPPRHPPFLHLLYDDNTQMTIGRGSRRTH